MRLTLVVALLALGSLTACGPTLRNPSEPGYVEPPAGGVGGGASGGGSSGGASGSGSSGSASGSGSSGSASGGGSSGGASAGGSLGGRPERLPAPSASASSSAAVAPVAPPVAPVVAASPATAPADASAPGATPAPIATPTNPLIPDLTRVKLNGYIVPSFVVTSRNDAVPRDRLTVGMVSSRSGLIASGTPYSQWRYVIHVGFEAAVVNTRVAGATKVLTGSGGGDKNGDGIPDGTDSFTFVTGVPIEEATINYSPFPWYTVTAGHQRIPFSVGAGATITAQMFPSRPGPTSVFMTGPDDGLVNTFMFLDERIQARVGIFNGNSLGLQLTSTTTAGPVWSAFFDLHPLGKMPPREGDSGRGPFRVGIGLGVLYRVGTLYDDKGYQATRFRDMRLSTALRASYYGIFLQGELLRRLQTDDLSSRPASATGAYAQASYYVRALPTIALGPLARYGVTVQDQAFAPQQTTSFEAGVALYPRADLPEPDSIRVIAEFLQERRSPSGEVSNGGVLHLLLKW